MKYVRTSCTIQCPQCQEGNTVILSITDRLVEKEAVIECINCGKLIAYDVKIECEPKSIRKLLKEIKCEDDIKEYL